MISYYSLILTNKELIDVLNETTSVLEIKVQDALRVMDQSCNKINEQHNYSISYKNFVGEVSNYIKENYYEKWRPNDNEN